MRIRDLLQPEAVDLNPAITSKEDAINHLVDLVSATGCISDIERFRQAVFDRENKSSTGLGRCCDPSCKKLRCIKTRACSHGIQGWP